MKNASPLRAFMWPLLATLLAGCAGVPPQPKAAQLQQVRSQVNPVERAQRTITNFTPALRCMDEMMFRLGTRDVTMMMEELRDATQKVPVSARDMMTSAVSEMTRRSRAVRLSVFGNDQTNLNQLLQQAQKAGPFSVLPEYNVRGTISQLDEDIQRRGGSFGVLFEKSFGLRLGSETKFSVLGFDAALVRTDSFTLVPGVASKNTTVITRQDTSAGDGQARILGAGTVFAFNAARAEGNAQAARNMVELATIELVGKLIRAPYWQCLGLADEEPEVRREVEDWFIAMPREELVVFVKERLREQRWFDGALDEQEDAAFTAALTAYRQAIGLPARGDLDATFFQRFITRAVARGPLSPLPRPALRAASSASAPAATAQAAHTPATTPAAASTAFVATAPAPPPPAAEASPPAAAALRLFTSQRDNAAQLRLAIDTAGYVYCYAQNPSTQAIQRIFPNRFARDPRLAAGQAITLPGASRFKLPADAQYACLHAPREVYGDLPPPLRWGDFEDVRLPSFDAIREQFSRASGSPVLLARAESIAR